LIKPYSLIKARKIAISELNNLKNALNPDFLRSSFLYFHQPNMRLSGKPVFLRIKLRKAVRSLASSLSRPKEQFSFINFSSKFFLMNLTASKSFSISIFVLAPKALIKNTKSPVVKLPIELPERGLPP